MSIFMQLFIFMRFRRFYAQLFISDPFWHGATKISFKKFVQESKKVATNLKKFRSIMVSLVKYSKIAVSFTISIIFGIREF